jgi:hypothetical protein
LFYAKLFNQLNFKLMWEKDKMPKGANQQKKPLPTPKPKDAVQDSSNPQATQEKQAPAGGSPRKSDSSTDSQSSSPTKELSFAERIASMKQRDEESKQRKVEIANLDASAAKHDENAAAARERAVQAGERAVQAGERAAQAGANIKTLQAKLDELQKERAAKDAEIRKTVEGFKKKEDPKSSKKGWNPFK